MGFFDDEPLQQEKKSPFTKVTRESSDRKEKLGQLSKVRANDMWVEKWRPKTLDEVIGQPRVISYFKSVLKNPLEMQNVLLHGNAGGGKTSIAFAFLKELYGEDYDGAVLELNASDTGRMEDVRESIRPFAYSMPSPSVPFNTCFLDEFDNTAPRSQPALRRIIEGLIGQNEPRRCRFILSCNQKQKVIEPIQSRCISFFIRPLPLEDVVSCLREIGLREGLKGVHFDVLKEIADHSNGDLRKAINTFQTLAILYGDNIPVESVSEVLGVPSQSTVFQIMNLALEGKFTDACTLAKEIAYQKGFTSESVISEMSFNLFSLPIKDELRARVASILAEYQVKVYSGGLNTDTLLNGILGEMCLLPKPPKPFEIKFIGDEKGKVVPLG